MAIFKYKALDANKRRIEGLIKGVNESEIANILRDKGMSIISLRKKSEEKKMIDFLTILNRIKPKDLVVFSRQFAVMISANVALVQSLRVIVNQTENLILKMVISEIADEVDGGLR